MERAAGKAEDFRLQDWSKIVLAYAKARHPTVARLFAAAAKAIVLMVHQASPATPCPPQALATVVWAFAERNQRDLALFDAAAGAAHRMLTDQGQEGRPSAQDVAQVAWAYAAVGDDALRGRGLRLDMFEDGTFADAVSRLDPKELTDEDAGQLLQWRMWWYEGGMRRVSQEPPALDEAAVWRRCADLGAAARGRPS